MHIEGMKLLLACFFPTTMNWLYKGLNLDRLHGTHMPR